MKRTAKERAADDRGSVQSNINDLGPHGALLYAVKRLTEMPTMQVRRMSVLTIKAAAKRLDQDLSHAKRMAAISARHLRQRGIKVPLAYVLLLALAAPAAAQEPRLATVYTNVANGKAQREIVAVVRPVLPAQAVPASLPGTPVPPAKWRPEIGGTSYVPPQRAAAPAIPAKQPQPWFVNGIYVGPSPSGNWMATSVGRPIVDVRIVDTPRRKP